MLLRELIQKRDLQGRGLARSVLLRDRFAAGSQEPAFPHVSPPREAQKVHDAMIQDVIPLIVEPGSESITSRFLGATLRDSRIPCGHDLEILRNHPTSFGQYDHINR